MKGVDDIFLEFKHTCLDLEVALGDDTIVSVVGHGTTTF